MSCLVVGFIVCIARSSVACRVLSVRACVRAWQLSKLGSLALARGTDEVHTLLLTCGDRTANGCVDADTAAVGRVAGCRFSVCFVHDEVP